MEKFRETGSISDAIHTDRQKTNRSNVIITSIQRRGQEVQISRSSLERILTKDLHLYAYKVQLTQELKPDYQAQ